MIDALAEVHAELTKKIIGIFFDVANELGSGFAESVYRKSLAIALREAGLIADEETPIQVVFRGQGVGLFYADLVIEDLVILELKTSEIVAAHQSQLQNYLRSTRMEIGYVFSFAERAHFKRSIFSNERKPNLQKTKLVPYPH